MDKNLKNTVDSLRKDPVTSQEAGQMQQAKDDRRKEMIANQDNETTH